MRVFILIVYTSPGGTTMCNIAVQAGMRVAKPVRNCLEPDELRGPGREGALVQYMASHRYQFVAHEFGPFLPLTGHSRRVLYVTVVRNPWDRVLSAAHHGEQVCNSITGTRIQAVSLQSARCLAQSVSCESVLIVPPSPHTCIHADFLLFLPNVAELCQKTLASSREAATARHCRFDVLSASAADVVLDPCFRRAFSSVDHYVNKFSPCPTSRASGGQPECGTHDLQKALSLLRLMSAVVVTDSPDSYARSFQVLTHIAPQLHYEPSLRSGTSAHSDAKYLLMYPAAHMPALSLAAALLSAHSHMQHLLVSCGLQ
jgi:hypothetical protein